MRKILQTVRGMFGYIIKEKNKEMVITPGKMPISSRS
jgi:hypothetical protein